MQPSQLLAGLRGSLLLLWAGVLLFALGFWLIFKPVWDGWHEPNAAECCAPGSGIALLAWLALGIAFVVAWSCAFAVLVVSNALRVRRASQKQHARSTHESA